VRDVIEAGSRSRAYLNKLHYQTQTNKSQADTEGRVDREIFTTSRTFQRQYASNLEILGDRDY
jgi:hypothetical protein